MSSFVSQFCQVQCSVRDQDSFINQLPTETLTQIFSYLNCPELVACIRTCARWREIIKNSEGIWRTLCQTLTTSNLYIETDRYCGYSWKDIYQRHYGANGLKHLWQQGTFSNPQSYQDLLDKPFCHLDTDTWGQILQWELDRL